MTTKKTGAAMKVKFAVGVGRGYKAEVFDYDDDVTDEELDEDWRGWSTNYIDGGFHRLDENEK